ncbi:hypothetical protein IFM89_034243 [Coptis chinensis]|uniref:Uncharacterized protein n=1 Tax=Coptis chinensis TaxID=261450 RepID=A0A835H8I3_9MAGN|nr:hypothetical protein IFM89_034243 [Coptis chinensis]
MVHSYGHCGILSPLLGALLSLKIGWMDSLTDGNRWKLYALKGFHLGLPSVSRWENVLSFFCNRRNLELELLYIVQTQCYGIAELRDLFTDIVRFLVQTHVVAVETIHIWCIEGTNTKGRHTFVNALKPFLKADLLRNNKLKQAKD